MAQPEGEKHNHDHDGHSDHDHGHEGHDHAPSVTEGNVRRIRFVFILTASYALIQAVGGWLSGSLALIADSGHMVSDAAALLLALIAYRVASRAADATRTYGFHRVRVLAALANGAALLVLVSWIVWEAVDRFREPTEVLAGPMLVVAVIGLLVNIAGFLILRMGSQDDANLRGAFLHVLGDLLGSVGAIAAAIGIMLTGWTVLDPILSVLVALLVVKSAWGLVSESIQVLLQATPRGMDAAEVLDDLRSLPGIAEVGHFHAWTLTDETRIATVHVVPMPGADPLSLPPLIGERLRTRHSIEHATVQVDPPGNIEICS
ncbi:MULTISPECIES: cation diffusion facilitator family transporter [Pseudomonas]|uniref:cation diffusion facilitator family transporter n=1 Tax=Pseudomonas TaxID=286 RepID=UPI001C80E049|nr:MULTISPECIES: cation diffusion facilitator family transporter [Pseudomonas]MDH0897591.1 cation diffusion facilitator family transporter [Pseudomonas sp. GD03875]MDH1067637.1 cation diffusion facilitator family transporter [Pseudomonas sp. GD03985]